MKAMKPFYFTHPQYGKLRVVVMDGKIYYCLMDVKNIFKSRYRNSMRRLLTRRGN